MHGFDIKQISIFLLPSDVIYSKLYVGLVSIQTIIFGLRNWFIKREHRGATGMIASVFITVFVDFFV